MIRGVALPAMALLALAAALALFIAPRPSAAAGDLRYFFCFATDPVSATTFVSDSHAVGPLTERRHYGDEFSAYLAARGKVSKGTQGYCVMRATEREIATGQRLLPETCTSCGEAKSFEPVAWLRGGKGGAQALVKGKLAPEQKAPPELESKAEEAKRSSQPAATGVIVLANSKDGRVVVRGNYPDESEFQQAVAEAREGSDSAWVELSSGSIRGWGAVACVGYSGGVYFGEASGLGSIQEARRVAMSRAELFMQSHPASYRDSSCGLTWNNDGRKLALDGTAIGPWTEPETGLVDYVKGQVRKQVVPGSVPDATELQPCVNPDAATGGSSAPEEALQWSDFAPPANASPPCPPGSSPQRSRFVCMCVRG